MTKIICVFLFWLFFCGKAMKLQHTRVKSVLQFTKYLFFCFCFVFFSNEFNSSYPLLFFFILIKRDDFHANEFNAKTKSMPSSANACLSQKVVLLTALLPTSRASLSIYLYTHFFCSTVRKSIVASSSAFILFKLFIAELKDASMDASL